MPRSWPARLAQVFALDLRALALMRIGLGASLLVDLALRASSVSQRFTDAGVLPRSVLLDHVVESLSPLALHSLSGELAWQQLPRQLAPAPRPGTPASARALTAFPRPGRSI